MGSASPPAPPMRPLPFTTPPPGPEGRLSSRPAARRAMPTAPRSRRRHRQRQELPRLPPQQKYTANLGRCKPLVDIPPPVRRVALRVRRQPLRSFMPLGARHQCGTWPAGESRGDPHAENPFGWTAESEQPSPLGYHPPDSQRPAKSVLGGSLPGAETPRRSSNDPSAR
jgi:hypothetical protein